jgi:TonB family protein
MTLSKETLEATTPASKAASPTAAQPKPDLNRLRADAVSLDVPVKVHGSRVTEVVRGVTPHTEPFEEESSTMIVFPHGGVVRMATAVSVGQMLVLTNLRSSQDAICRVVKVRAYSNTQAYVEVEFTHRQPGYWGVHFPADDEESGLGTMAAAPAAVDTVEKKPVISSVSMKVETIAKAPATPHKTESAFAPIGSHEDVQPSASQTEIKPKVVPIAQPTPQLRVAPTPAPVAPAAAVAHVAAPPVVALPAKPVAVTREIVEPEIEEIEEAPVEAPRSSRSFGTLTGGSGKATRSGEAAEYLAHSEPAVHVQAAAPRGNVGLWIGACVFFLVAGLAGGAFYFRQHSAAPQQQAAMATPQSVQQSAADTTAQSQASQPAAENTQPAPSDRSGRASSQPSNQAPIQEVAEAQPRSASTPARELRPAPAPPTFVASNNARPVARANSKASEAAAPSVIGATSANTAEISDVIGSSNVAAPPAPTVRVRVGGVIVQPQLVHSVPPIYPTAARTANISGNVVLNAQVDKDGNVSSVKVVSGPVPLQAAAIAAMKQWKYKAATLDADPIATTVTVTIRFQQQ